MLSGRQLPSMRVSRVVPGKLGGGPDWSARCLVNAGASRSKRQKALEFSIGYFTSGQL